MLYALKPEPALSLRSTVTALMLLISCCLLLRACLAAQVGGDYEDYEYEVEVDVSKLRKNAGSRLVNARATAASEYQFVGAFFLSSSPHPHFRLPSIEALYCLDQPEQSASRDLDQGKCSTLGPVEQGLEQEL